MYNNNDFFQNMTMENNVSGDNNYINQDMDVDINMMSNMGGMMQGGCPMNEPVQEKCIHKTIVHEVPQVC